MKKCPFCEDGYMFLETRNDIHKYKGFTQSTTLFGQWCNSCNEGILDGYALINDEKEFLDFKAKIDEIISKRS